MKATIIFIAVLLSVSNLLYGQTRTIYGRVIAEDDLLPIPTAIIRTMDGIVVRKTDAECKFKINVPQNIQKLLIRFVGYEPATIKLNADCDTVEIVMLIGSTYDFMSSRKVDELRLKQFNKLPDYICKRIKKVFLQRNQFVISGSLNPSNQDSIRYKKGRLKKKDKLN